MKKLVILTLTFILGSMGVFWLVTFYFQDTMFFETMPHHNYYPFEYWPFFLLRGLFIPFILIIIIIMVVVYHSMHSTEIHDSQSVLDERLAKGELSIEEYKQIKALIHKRGELK